MVILRRLLYAALLVPSWLIAMFMHWRAAPKFLWVSPISYADRSSDVTNVIISILIWTLLTVLIFDICL